MPRKKELSFEEALGRLNEIVDQMEQGDLPLKDLIANYSEGGGSSGKDCSFPDNNSICKPGCNGRLRA